MIGVTVVPMAWVVAAMAPGAAAGVAHAQDAAHAAARVTTLVTMQTPIKARRAPGKMKRAQVRAHNARLIAQLNTGLPKRRPRWRHIVVHHTASEWSTLARIDAYHRDKFEDPDGIEYHFLIGNGKKRPEGYIERARWDKQIRSIHLFKPEGAPDAITISMIGNFHERDMGEAQYEALRDLVVALAIEHDVPATRVTTHTRVDGNLTVCPGRHFPTKRLLEDVAERLGE